MKTPDPTKAGSSARNGIESSAKQTKATEILLELYAGSSTDLRLSARATTASTAPLQNCAARAYR